MKILIYNRHIPYSYDLCRALQGEDITHVGWQHLFRPYPNNVRLVHSPEDVRGQHFDLCISDNRALDWSLFTSDRYICIEHNECYTDITDEIRESFRRFDTVVSVSAHKLTTWRELVYEKRFEMINLAVSGEDYPEKEDYSGTTVGTAWNGLSQNKAADNWLSVSSIFPGTVLIGHDTDSLGSRLIAPNGLDEYRAALRSIDVFVHVMTGDVTGMAPREAMASGIPVISPVTPELYNDCFDGFDISLHLGRFNPVEIRRRIVELLNDQQTRERMGRNARRTALRVWPMSDFVSRWRRICLPN